MSEDEWMADFSKTLERTLSIPDGLLSDLPPQTWPVDIIIPPGRIAGNITVDTEGFDCPHVPGEWAEDD